MQIQDIVKQEEWTTWQGQEEAAYLSVINPNCMSSQQILL